MVLTSEETSARKPRSRAAKARLLTESPLPPAAPLLAASFSGSWREHAASGISPRVVTEGTASARDQEAWEAGFKLLRLDLAKRGALPQQLKTVDVVSCGRRFAVVLEPRQSSKTTTIEAYLLGLCATVPGIQIAYAVGTTGKAGRDHYLKKIVPPIEALYRDKSTRPMKIRTAGGQERISFDNGSLFQVCATPDDFRGSSFDVVWIDEAGELEGQDAVDMLSAAQPTQDTRGGVIFDVPLMIVSGTAGNTRPGNVLWDFLERGRNGDESVAIIEYSAGIDLVVEDVEDWEADVVPLLLTSHPGVDTLTTLDTIRGNFLTMDRERFMREYLGIFGSTGTVTGVINLKKWTDAELNTDVPRPPDHFAVGAAVHRNGGWSAIAAAWRDADGRAHVALLAHREGVTWLAPELVKLAQAHKLIPIAHDDRGPVRIEVASVKRDYPRARLVPRNTGSVCDAAVLLVKETHTGNLRHYGQQALTTAALSARQRDIGPNQWAFGRPSLEADTTGVEAASIALLTYDQTPPRKPQTVYFGN
jgi:hypothetical protein